MTLKGTLLLGMVLLTPAGQGRGQPTAVSAIAGCYTVERTAWSPSVGADSLFYRLPRGGRPPPAALRPGGGPPPPARGWGAAGGGGPPRGPAGGLSNNSLPL